jgi:hypothetical protein
MKFTAKRLIGAGIISLAAIVTPISVAALSGGPGSIASAQPVACTPIAGDTDAVCYIQTSGGANTYQYDSGAAPNTPQAVTVSSQCATTSGSAYLTMCGWAYPTATPSNATITPPSPGATPSTVGTSSGETGVCAVSPCYSLENKTSGNKATTDALDFSPGPAKVVAGRPFNDAQIQIQRKDNGVTSFPSVDVQLAELDANRQVLATQDCSLTGGTGQQITADTDGPGIGTTPTTPANCTTTSGTLPSTFTTVEVRDMTNSTSIYVVGTATFSLQNQICGGQTPINPTGAPAGVSAPLSIPLGSGCKIFTSYNYTESASSPDVQGTHQTLSFNATSNGTIPFNISVTWAPIEPACQPTTDSGTVFQGMVDPSCGDFQFILNGDPTNYDEVFCPAPQRTDAATVTNGQDSVSDLFIVAADTGRQVTGTGIPAGTYVGTVTPGIGFLLSASPISQANVNATATSSSGVTLAGTPPPPAPGSQTSPTCVWNKTYTIVTGADGNQQTIIHEEISALTDYSHVR